MAQKYLEMTDAELLMEIKRVQDIIMSSNNFHTTKQNRVYLQKLHKEWRRRKDERSKNQ